MTITKGYCTLVEFTARTGLNSKQVTDKTTLIEREIERNSRIIDRVTSNRFYKTTLTSSKVRYNFGENTDGLRMAEDARRIYFPSDAIVISAITSNGDTLVADEDYFVGTNFIEAIGVFSTERINGVVITGTCGRDTTPDDVNEICLAMSEVTTGLGTITMIDANETKIDVTRDNIPDWVFNQLYHRVRMSSYG